MNNDYVAILTKIRETPWLIMPESLYTILSIVDRRMNGERLTSEQLEVLLGNQPGHDVRQSQASGGVGVIDLVGPIFPKANMMTEYSGATSLETFRQDFRTLMQNDLVHSVILNIDSPGGMSDLVKETGDEIRAARDVKPIYAVANTTAGSAAYWLGAQASRLYATPSGQVGSVGAYTVHEDISRQLEQEGVKPTIISAGRFKVEGNPYEPLSAEGRSYRQEVIDKLYDQFVYAISKGRNVDTETVKANFGEGRMLMADDAAAAGMVDGVMELDDVIQSALIGSELPAAQHMHPMPVAALANRNHAFVPRARMEHADLEHSEPGQGEVIPRSDQDPDKAAQTGSRRDSPPAAFEPEEPPTRTDGGYSMNPLLRSYAEALGISVSDDATDESIRKLIAGKLGIKYDDSVKSDEEFMAALATHTVQLQDEVGPLREAHRDLVNREAFATQFPEEAARMARLEATNRDNEKKAFEARVSVVRNSDGTASKFALTTAAKDMAVQAYSDLRAGNLDPEGLATLINTVASQSGTVELGERGSSISSETVLSGDASVLGIRQQFAAAVQSIMTEDKLEYGPAVKEAARRHPDLFEQYQSAHTRS